MFEDRLRVLDHVEEELPAFDFLIGYVRYSFLHVQGTMKNLSLLYRDQSFRTHVVEYKRPHTTRHSDPYGFAVKLASSQH